MKLRSGIPLKTLPGFQGLDHPGGKLSLVPAADLRPGNVDWTQGKRPLTPEEQTAILMGGDPAEAWVGRLALPAHLFRKWESAIGEPREEGVAMDPAPFASFMAAVIQFLQFKEVPLPARCQCDALAVFPSHGLLRLDPVEDSPPVPAESLIAINLGQGCADVIYGPEDADDPTWLCLRLEPREGVCFSRGDTMSVIYLSAEAEAGTVLRMRSAGGS